MNRADVVKQILVLEQFATEARAAAAKHRETLAVAAREEYTSTGTAPTWRIPSLGKVVLPISQTKIVVSDVDKLTDWVQHRSPEEIETVTTVQVRPAHLAALLNTLIVTEDDVVVDGETGEIVPGLSASVGGQPKALSITVDTAAKRVLSAAAAQLLGTAQAAIAGPVVDGDPVDEATAADPPGFAASGDPFALFPPTPEGEPS